MKKTSMTRKAPEGAKRSCWRVGSGQANGEEIRDRARNEIVNALPALIQVLLTEAHAGSVAHIKLLVQLERDLAATEPNGHRGKNLEEILMEQWAKDAENEDRDELTAR